MIECSPFSVFFENSFSVFYVPTVLLTFSYLLTLFLPAGVISESSDTIAFAPEIVHSLLGLKIVQVYIVRVELRVVLQDVRRVEARVGKCEG